MTTFREAWRKMPGFATFTPRIAPFSGAIPLFDAHPVGVRPITGGGWMQGIIDRTRGLSVLLDVNFDRVLFPGTIVLALFAAAFLASL